MEILTFRRGYAEHAVQVAHSIKQLVVTSAEGILRKAQLVAQMKLRLNRKEWGIWLREMLGWFGNEATQYLQVAKVFQDFDPAVFCDLEPFVILKLRTKRYALVVERLREELALTSQLVQDFIKELLPKQSKKKAEEPISGWKQTRSGGGRYYNVLLHDEQIGESIEQQAEAEQVLPQKVIAEAVALRAKQKSGSVLVSGYRAAQLEEIPQVVDNARSLDRENRRLELELSRRDRTIADLEAKLALRVATPLVEPDGVQEHAQAQQEEVAATAIRNSACPEDIALVESQHAMDEAMPADDAESGIALVASESVDEVATQEPKVEQHPEQQAEAAIAMSPENDHLVEPQENAQNLGAERNSVLQSGDLVQINATSDRTWNGLTSTRQHLKRLPLLRELPAVPPTVSNY